MTMVRHRACVQLVINALLCKNSALCNFYGILKNPSCWISKAFILDRHICALDWLWSRRVSFFIQFSSAVCGAGQINVDANSFNLINLIFSGCPWQSKKRVRSTEYLNVMTYFIDLHKCGGVVHGHRRQVACNAKYSCSTRGRRMLAFFIRWEIEQRESLYDTLAAIRTSLKAEIVLLCYSRMFFQ